MDVALKTNRDRQRHALLLTALAAVIPQVLGSIFNIWYNTVVIDPLLGTGALRQRFFQTIIFYNALAFPVGVAFWLGRVFSLRPVFNRLRAGLPVDDQRLAQARRRLIHLPWWIAVVSGAAWLLCIPVFLGSLAAVEGTMDPRLLVHLPISFCVSAFIAITHTFFLVELASHWGLFPVFFRDARADLTPGAVTLTLRGRGLLWAISAAICPIVSLLLLIFAPASTGSDPRWFAVFVGAVGIAFGLCTALMMSRLVAKPIDQLRAAAQAVGAGQFDVQVPVTRADEFGVLIGEFNQMTLELKDKERLRQTFGLHVGERAAEQILARDPGLGGIEQEITVMFVDIRSFTSRAETNTPHETLEVLNEFLRVTVCVVEEEYGGMINKYLGDGFMALFGIGGAATNHAQAAFDAGRGILRALARLNCDFLAQGRAPLGAGIGIHSGPAIVGSIGSPQRLEFTAIGSTVNLASRIESLTKQAGAPLLITAATRERLENAANLVELPPQQVRGVDEPVKVFALQIREEALL
jgi:adenylate cyclase